MNEPTQGSKPICHDNPRFDVGGEVKLQYNIANTVGQRGESSSCRNGKERFLEQEALHNAEKAKCGVRHMLTI